MGRSPCCVKEGLNKGAWTSQEDKILTEYIKVHGEGKWRNLPKKAGLKRCGKSCRLRWLNYLRPDIKRGNITNDEEDLIIRLHKLLGNRWSLIAGRLPGRTDNEIKNYWNTNIGKRLLEGHHHHPSSSTTGSKPSSSIKSSRAKKNLSKKGSCVVRTKATRCTKVFINAELEQTQKPGIMATKEDGIIEKTGLETEAVAMAAAKVSKDNSSNFLMDIEMDEKFLYEFFRGEFITSCDLKTRQDSELGSVASLLDPSDLNWLLQDQ